MTYESGIVPENWRSAVIVPLYKGKGESTEYKNYGGISLYKCGWKNICGYLSRYSL